MATCRIALASVPLPTTVADGVAHTKDARTILHELMTGPN